MGVFLFIAAAAALAALPPQLMAPSGHWVYDALAELSAEDRRVFFDDSMVTVEQVSRFLDEIDPAVLSDNGRETYDALGRWITSSAGVGINSDIMTLNLDAEANPEFYYKSSEDVPWIYNYHERNPLLLFRLTMGMGDYLAAEADPYLGQNEKSAERHDVRVNVPYEPVAQFDIHFPSRAYLSAGAALGKASGVNFAIGLGDDFMGRTETGSIILSEYLKRVTYAQLTLYSPLLKYTAEVSQLEVNKYQYMHYITVRPFKIFSITLSEGVMVNAPLELRFLNPFTIFHSHEAYKTYGGYNKDLGHSKSDSDADDYYEKYGGSRIGSFFGMKVELRPIRSLRLYGLFAMNQFQLGIEKSEWDDLAPNAMAFQAGTELTFPFRRGYLNLGLEGVYTQPYMYVLWDKKWSFYKEAYEVDNTTVRYWTGSPFGPDTIAGTVWAGYSERERFSLKASFTLAAQGKRSGLEIFDTDAYRPTHAVYDVTRPPTGIPQYTFTGRLSASVSPLRWLTLSLNPGYRYVVNSGHDPEKNAGGFEAAFSARARPFSK
jgi:hypothetical protein